MTYRTMAPLAALGLLAATVIGGSPAGADQLQPVAITPSSASAGTTIAISGEDCIDGATPGGAIIDVEYQSDGSQSRTFSIPAGTDGDGSWSATYVISDTDPVGSYDVEATCYKDVNSDPPNLTVHFHYAKGTFEVTDASSPAGLPVSIDPTSGPIGTTVTVSGSNCAGDLVSFALLAGSGLHDATAVVDAAGVEPAGDGTWSGELLVYDTMLLLTGDADAPEEVPVEVGGDYFVIAACEYHPGEFDEPGPSPDEIVFSDPVDFDITGGGDAPRTDPPPATPITAGVRPDARPARPVVAQPTFTG
jgi:hypothetical protein